MILRKPLKKAYLQTWKKKNIGNPDKVSKTLKIEISIVIGIRAIELLQTFLYFSY